MLKNGKKNICMLAAVLIFLLAIPSFAANGSGEPYQQNGETIEQPEQEQEETAEETGETEEEDLQSTEEEEQIEQPEQTEDPAELPAEAEEKAEAAPAGLTAAPEKASAPAPALKAASALPDNNSKVSYTSAGSHPVKFSVKTAGYTFKGTCATLGIDNASSGKATVKRISNNSRIAKLVYYYGYKKGWWQGKNSSKKATAVMGFSDSRCTENAKQCIEALIQRDNMGWDAFWAARKVGKYRMYSTDSFMKEISSLYKNTDVSKITIPDDVVFEMFHGVTSSSRQQDFYVWRYKEVPTTTNGFAAVEKVSADVSITN